MAAALALSRTIDWINTFIGRSVAWLVLVAVMVSAGNAIVRKVFDASSNAWLELQWYLFGAVFMLAAAYTLRQNEHIRIDIFYGQLSRRKQHWIDLFGHVFFLMPFVLLMSFYFVPLRRYLLQEWRGFRERRRPVDLARPGLAADRLRYARLPGRLRDHQEDRDHARRHRRPDALCFEPHSSGRSRTDRARRGSPQ